MKSRTLETQSIVLDKDEHHIEEGSALSTVENDLLETTDIIISAKVVVANTVLVAKNAAGAYEIRVAATPSANNTHLAIKMHTAALGDANPGAGIYYMPLVVGTTLKVYLESTNQLNAYGTHSDGVLLNVVKLPGTIA